MDYDTERYKSRYFIFCEPVPFHTVGGDYGGWKMQVQLNCCYMPNYAAGASQLYNISRNSLPVNTKAKKMSRRQYIKNFCVQCFRLNFPDSEYTYTLSGLDTRSSNLAGSIITQNVNASLNANLTIFTESTSVMRVGSGRSVEIIS